MNDPKTDFLYALLAMDDYGSGNWGGDKDLALTMPKGGAAVFILSSK